MPSTTRDRLIAVAACIESKSSVCIAAVTVRHRIVQLQAFSNQVNRVERRDVVGDACKHDNAKVAARSVIVLHSASIDRILLLQLKTRSVSAMAALLYTVLAPQR